MELIFILTYNCNYRCHYCDIDKRAEDMSEAVLAQSLIFLGRNNFPLRKTKFFGGEPTLKLDDIFHIIDHFPSSYETGFYITTNGSLLDARKISQIQSRNIITTVSLDGDQDTTDANRVGVGKTASHYQKVLTNISGSESYFRVNQVITPKNVVDMQKNFEYLYKLGFREFNFLPEYYTEWSKASLNLLASGFEAIKNSKSLHPIYLVNAENYSPTSFFNIGVVIDTDGSIYGTNLILSGRFEKYKNELRIGSVYDLDFSMPEGEDQREYLKKIETLLQKEYSHSILKSVYYINQILSHFTLGYGK